MNAKQVKWLVLSVVVILATVTGVLVATSGRPDSAGGAGTVFQTVTVPPNPYSDSYHYTPSAVPSATEPVTTDPTTSSPEPPLTSPAGSAPASSQAGTSAPGSSGGRPASNIPMTKLAPGEKPPQFIIFSFDGAGRHDKMQEFMATAQSVNARFTGFLSGVYLLADSNANVYRAPGANQGASDVGFGGEPAEVTERINDLNQMYAMGNEIGTHYNGHFCGLGANWSTAEWNNELDQFFKFFANWKTINGLTDAPDLQIPSSEVKGGRTPCLSDIWSQVNPAWKDHGMTYDSSEPAPRDGIYWPQMVDGIWEFYMPQVYSAGLGGKVTAMDYNFWVKFNGGKADPSSAPTLTPIVLDTYRFMYQQAYNGNRAPVLIANHFNDWNGNSFNPATDQFMKETCTQPDTYCATYQDVIAWMELQDPAVLATLQDAFPVAYQAGG